MGTKERDLEAFSTPTRLSHFAQVLDQKGITPEVEAFPYEGSGTPSDPYIVAWIPNDPRNPQNYSPAIKWLITALVATAALAVTFCSSAYSSGGASFIAEFHCSEEIFTLGLSLFVLGFAIGPLMWGPLSELFGRQKLFLGTYMALTAFNCGVAGSNNVATLIVLRFLAGAFGASPLTNSGGVIADMFTAKKRGLALSFFAAAPFTGPVLGPIVGGFVDQTVGWRAVMGVMAIFTGVMWIVGGILLPETYGPVILRQRAAELSRRTGKVYKSRGDIEQGPATFGDVFRKSLLRPWILLFREPIVLLLSIYMAIIYGTLYMLFGAFPIVYQDQRGWSDGIGGLAFLGVAVGVILAIGYSIWDNKRYQRTSDAHNGFAPPEARLPPTMVGGIVAPIGLFWFAWTNGVNTPWIVSIMAGAPFGFAMVLIFLGIQNYLIDTYTIFAASVLAANSVIRSLFGAAFPLFTSQMYANLGIHWASSVPAFLALLCLPMPFLFYRYGAKVRESCKFAAESAAFMQRVQREKMEKEEGAESMDGAEVGSTTTTARDAEAEMPELGDGEPEFAPIKTEANRASARGQLQRTSSGIAYDNGTGEGGYNESPFDLDRVNTKDSFKKSSRRGSLRSTKSGGQ